MGHHLTGAYRALTVVAVVAVVSMTAGLAASAVPAPTAAVAVPAQPTVAGAVVSVTPARIADSRAKQQINGAVPVAGLADRDHLENVAKLIGEHHVQRTSAGTSSGRGSGSRSTTVSYDRELIMSVDELSALPSGRFVAILSGGYPILGATVPWFERPAMAPAVAASVAA